MEIMDTRNTHGGSAQRGFNLIEVMIALGMLAAVLVAIGSMFVMGGRQLKTGKTITQATALAHDLMESFENQSFVTLYTNLGAASTASTITVSSTATGSPIATWQPEIIRKLSNGSATVRLSAMGPGTPTFGSAVGLRLTATVTWAELGRPQTVTISTMRF